MRPSQRLPDHAQGRAQGTTACSVFIRSARSTQHTRSSRRPQLLTPRPGRARHNAAQGERSVSSITTTMRQCVPSANSSRSSVCPINKKTHPNGGTGRNPWCHPASSPGLRAGRPLSDTLAQSRAMMPRALVTVALSVHAYFPVTEGVRMETPRSIRSLRARRLSPNPVL